jgi:hypothetical protein
VWAQGGQHFGGRPEALVRILGERAPEHRRQASITVRREVLDPRRLLLQVLPKVIRERRCLEGRSPGKHHAASSPSSAWQPRSAASRLECPVPFQPVTDGEPLYPLHHDERNALRVSAVVKQAHDVGVDQPAHCFGFLLEALYDSRLFGEVRMQAFTAAGTLAAVSRP